MLKYLAKISMDIFPSVLATIIGAYIVNHYINAKPAADTPTAVVAPAEAGKDAKPADTASLPAPGVKAKGVSEKSVSEKSVTDKAAAEKPADKPETKAADTAPAETASHGRPAREKAAAKSTPAATTPVVEASSAPAAASPAAAPDANDLARAAIERLRKSPEGKAAEKAAEAKAAETKAAETKPVERTPEPAVREATRVPEAPRVVTTEPSAVRPLPPPITVSTPSPEAYGNAGSPPSYTASVGNDDPNRITPPADIPVPVIAPPLDLRADAGGAMPRPKKTNVADEMLSGMKSMFHSVLPKSSTPD
ncbi:hypothetical protein QA649_38435 [Bradyrhizobium sp. CB1717]|uniref:hypothetical protein n=1 Tax=Bradyrhizobium sp. CB1717 TaxID=3039154 RepID=UPI0024B1E351|nr:hypothetical protein [Bradyrhizobium sp. CB1717]WFU23821.1 hypothetical protein QA649_38435 [Bradyrhizobium sp. CB1717]